jgi:tetratricopeptide (TPR) repeat protein
LALAIARQLNAEYPAAIDALRLALEIDPDYANAYNTLAMTQKLMGAYEKALHNYDAGAKALARAIVRSLQTQKKVIDCRIGIAGMTSGPNMRFSAQRTWRRKPI